MATCVLHSSSVQAAPPCRSHSLPSLSAPTSSSLLLPPVRSCYSSLSGKQLSSRRARCRRPSWQPLHVAAIAAGPPKSAAETEWRTKREALLRNRVRSVSPKEAARLVREQGYTILDVRPEGDFDASHPEGAVNVQVYRLIKEWTAWDIARRAAFAFFGIFQGTEENPEFVKEVASKLNKDSKIIIACATGGKLKPTPNLADGVQSRSLIAAYLLTLEGYTNLLHLEGGLNAWFDDELPTYYKDA